jgi:hypothetical protein
MRMFNRLMLLSTLGYGLGCSSAAPAPVSPGNEDGGGSSGGETVDGGGSSGGQGTPPGDSGGTACSVNGTTYASGAQFPSGDGCNVCICNGGQSACTTLACPVTDSGAHGGGGVSDASGDQDALGPIITGTATGTEVFTPAQVQAARANCNKPHGPVQSLTTFGAVYTELTGSWLLCSVGGSSAPTMGWGTLSREFDTGGQWYSLGLDAQGGLVRLLGVDNQGTWSIEDGSSTVVDGGASMPISSVTLNMGFDSGGGNGGTAAFESSPTRMSWSPDYFQAWYVPIGH